MGFTAIVTAVLAYLLFFLPPSVFFLSRYDILTGAGRVIGLALAAFFFTGAYVFGFRDRNLASATLLAEVCTVIALAVIGLLVTNNQVDLLWFAFLASLYLFVVIAVPRFLASGKRFVYDKLFSSKTKSPDEIILNKIFDASKFDYKCDVLVFGHTHVADFGFDAKNTMSPILVNTGTWVQDNIVADKTKRDTFAYIDDKGICCLRWVYDEKTRQGHIECYCKKKGDPPVNTPLCKCFTEYRKNMKS